jgi:ABC-2 type transport system permease protein
MQYRSFFFVLAFGWMIPPLIYLFVWSSAAGQGSIAGFSRGEFVAYYLVLILVNQLTYPQTNWTVGDAIRTGSFSGALLRPMWPLYGTISTEIAGKVVFMAFVVPTSALLAVLLQPELRAGPADVVLFAIALAFAWLLRFMWGYWLACLAFWATRADALLAAQDALVFLLSGVVAPVPLLPGLMQTASQLLPFRYMVGFPVEVLMGHLSAGDVLAGFMLQTVWLFVALLICRMVWRAGLRHYAAIGG